MLIVDPQRAVIAAAVVIAIGLFIFAYRNKKNNYTTKNTQKILTLHIPMIRLTKHPLIMKHGLSSSRIIDITL